MLRHVKYMNLLYAYIIGGAILWVGVFDEIYGNIELNRLLKHCPTRECPGYQFMLAVQLASFVALVWPILMVANIIIVVSVILLDMICHHIYSN